jgi:hypothetical protein
MRHTSRESRSDLSLLDLDETVNQKYVNLVRPAIEGQLARAGTRLAVILNQIWHD